MEGARDQEPARASPDARVRRASDCADARRPAIHDLGGFYLHLLGDMVVSEMPMLPEEARQHKFPARVSRVHVAIKSLLTTPMCGRSSKDVPTVLPQDAE